MSILLAATGKYRDIFRTLFHLFSTMSLTNGVNLLPLQDRFHSKAAFGFAWLKPQDLNSARLVHAAS